MDWKQLSIKLMDFIMYNLPPGPKSLHLHFVINIQKVGMPFYLCFLMWYYENYSDTMWFLF